MLPLGPALKHMPSMRFLHPISEAIFALQRHKHTDSYPRKRLAELIDRLLIRTTFWKCCQLPMVEA